MKNCTFTRHGDFLICDRCGNRVRTQRPADKLVMKCTKQYPSIVQTIANGVTSAVNYVASGMENVSDEEATRRLAICTGNEEQGIPACPMFDKEQYRCIECSCFMSWKSKMLSEHCPLQKW